MYHALSFESGFDPAHHMMDGAQGTDEAAEDPAQKKGYEEQAKSPPESFHKLVS
jgi:hypothetical protein